MYDFLKVGPAYGRRTLNGLLRSEGVITGEQRLRRAMANVTPAYVQHRQQHTYHQLNPVPYYAEYFGHKLHMDQNEKLVRFGVTHVAASDGYSGKLLGIVSMPVKNNIVIFDELYRYEYNFLRSFVFNIITCNRSIVLEHGLWDQVRVDSGREFGLVLHVQNWLSPLRTNTRRPPYVQTQSRHVSRPLFV